MRALFILFLPFFSTHADDFLQIVNQALDRSPEFRQLANQKQYENTLVKNKFSELLLPSLELNFSEIEQERSFDNQPNDYRLNQLQASLSIFQFGSDWKGYQAAKKRRLAYSDSLTAKLIEQEEAIMGLLFKYIAAQKVIEIRNQLLDLKQQVYNISNTKYKRGSLSRDDLIKVEIDLSNAKSELIASQQDILSLENQIKALQLKTPPELFPWQKHFTTSKISRMKNWTLDLSSIPQLRQYRYAEEQFSKEAHSITLSHFGEISWSYNRNQFLQEDTKEYGWSTALTYTLPLFEKYSRETQVQLARAKAQTAQTLYTYQKKLIQQSLANAKKDLKLSYANYQNRLQTLKNAERLFKNSTKQFRAGRLSVNDLLVEQDRLLKTKILTNDSIKDMHVSYLNYFHQFGLPMTLNKHEGIFTR